MAVGQAEQQFALGTIAERREVRRLRPEHL
jgi:hypothetical protein